MDHGKVYCSAPSSIKIHGIERTENVICGQELDHWMAPCPNPINHLLPAPNNYPFGAEMPVCGRTVKGNQRCVVPVIDGNRDRCPNRENHAEPCSATSRYGETNERCRGYSYGSNCTHAHLHVRPSEKRCGAIRNGAECRGDLRDGGRCVSATRHDPVPTPVFHHDAEVVPWWVKILDHYGVPQDAGRPYCADVLRQRGHKINAKVLTEVLKARRAKS